MGVRAQGPCSLIDIIATEVGPPAFLQFQLEAQTMIGVSESIINWNQRNDRS